MSLEDFASLDGDDQLLPNVRDHEAELARLSRLNSIDYERERTGVAQSLGVRVSALDKMRADRRTASECDSDDGRQGRALNLPDCEPWPEEVDGPGLVADLVSQIRRHVVLSEDQALAVALWVMHSHAQTAAEHSPRLHIASPEKRCGKTTLLSVLWPLVPRPVGTESISTSALFRTIEVARPTLLIDEADSFLSGNEGLRGILNAGHSRSGTVIRSVGDEFEPRQFSVWCPTIIAGIGRIPSTLEDRSITIQLRRRLPTEMIERLRSTRREHLFVLGRKAARWVSDHLRLLAESDPELPDALGDREQDNWRPLIAIAEAVGAGYPSVARSAALALSRVDVEDEQSAGVMLLADVWSILQERQADRIRSADVVLALVAMEHRPWSEWRRGKPLNQSTVSRLLKPFGIETRKSRFGNETARAYERQTISDACERYAPLAIAAEGSKTGLQSGTVEQTSRNNDLRETPRGTPIATVPPRDSVSH